MKIKKKINNRLQDVIYLDKKSTPKFIVDIIKSDFFYLINNYFEVDFDEIDIVVDLDDKNRYTLNINAKCDRLKMMKYLP